MSKEKEGGQMMEELVVSMMRFSTAMTLFGMDQLQSAMKMMGGRENLSDSVERMRAAIDSMTEAVAGEMDEKKRETLDSFTQASKDAVNRTMESMNVSGMDPAGIWKATSDVMRKTTDSVTDWMSGESGEEGSGEPKAAADVLSKKKPAARRKTTK